MKSLIDQRGDIHHIFPKKYLQKCGIKESGMYNQIANYVYTQSEINIKVKDQAPKEYMARLRNSVQASMPFVAALIRFLWQQSWQRLFQTVGDGTL